MYVSYRLKGLVRVQTGFGCRSQCVGGLEGTGVGGGALKSLWQQKAGLEPVDLFESAVKHRADGYTAQRTRKGGKRASEHGEGCA